MTEHEAKLITGGLSHPSKMPCPAFSLPASACKTGAKLAQQDGTVCSKCYADGRGNYRFPVVKNSLQRRLDLLNYWMKEDPREWVEAFKTMLSNLRFFRWHDSGDVQGKPHLNALVAIAEALPDTKFWLPTHEVWVGKLALADHWPPNLLVRMSASKLDGPAHKFATHTSTVHKHTGLGNSPCPAPSQGNQCGECRKCWDRDVPNIAYHYH